MKIQGKIQSIIPELLKLDMSKYYTCEIKEPKSQRSLKQNALLWRLIHKLAKATYQDDMDVYCAVLEKADALSEYIITAFDMEKDLRKSFRGVKFVRMQEGNGKDCYVYKVYLGSSKMDVKEMNELLDIVIMLCEENGVPTMED